MAKQSAHTRGGNWRIRDATVDDVDALMRIRLDVRENRLSDPSRVQPSDVHDMLTVRGRGWVAVDSEDRPVGFAIADHLARNVWALFLEPEFERRGIGRALHDTMMRWLFETSTDCVWLSTDPGTRAERFYRAAGWRAAGSTSHGETRFEMSADEWREREGSRITRR